MASLPAGVPKKETIVEVFLTNETLETAHEDVNFTNDEQEEADAKHRAEELHREMIMHPNLTPATALGNWHI